MKLLDARIGHLKEQHQCLTSHRFSCEAYDVCEHHYQVAPIHLKHEKHFQEQKRLDSHSSRTGNPSNLSPVSRRDDLRFSGTVRKQQFVSCTSNLLEQKYDFQKRAMFLQKWISNLQDLPQSQSLEKVPVCIVKQYHPHDNIVCIHKYDEFLK